MVRKLLIWAVAWISLFWWFRRKKPPATGYIIKRYVLSACDFAEGISHVTVSTKLSVEAALLDWETAEREYAELGFRTLQLADFIDHVSWGVPLKNVGVKRAKGEEPVFHGYYYRIYCLRRKGAMHDLHTLLSYEGLLDYDPQRRLKRFQS